MDTLNVKQLIKKFGRVAAVNGVSFTAVPGKILALVGPNGAGKSTVLAMIAGLLDPDAGTISWGGKDLLRWSLVTRVRNGVALVRQHSNPLMAFTVRENMRLFEVGVQTRLRGINHNTGIASAEMVGLSGKLDAYPRELTHGDLRRLEVARALILNPEVLLIDEPFAGLAPEEITDFVCIFKRLREAGKIIIIVDHDIETIRKLADTIVLMNLGAVLLDGNTEEVFQSDELRKIYMGEIPEATEAPKTKGRPLGNVTLTHGLAVEGMTVRYGAHEAVKGLTLTVKPGTIHAIVGLNGAGKTSVCNAIMGFIPYSGSVSLNGRPLERLDSWERVRGGLGYVPEGRHLCKGLTVTQHFQLSQSLSGLLARESEERILTLFPRLKNRAYQRAGSLSGGEQQMLAIARALNRRPSFLVVDEPTLGLAPAILGEISRAFQMLAGEGLGILLMEQNVNFASQLATSFGLMHDGSITSEGNGAHLLTNEHVLQEVVGVRPVEVVA